MEKNIGVRPDCIGNGCMQDIHWSGGALGYFPTYTIGAMTASQLFKALQGQVSGWDDSVRRGDFTSVFEWLRSNVHHRASSVSMDEMVADATGSVLDVDVFKQHLRDRYLAA